jgi:hypothetical protein
MLQHVKAVRDSERLVLPNVHRVGVVKYGPCTNLRREQTSTVQYSTPSDN